MAGKFVLGAKGIEQALRQLPDEVAKRVAVSALKQGGELLVDGMKARAPRRTGALAASPVVSSAAKVTGGRCLVSVGFKKPVSRRVHLTEFGTEHSRAVPFIRPTLDQDGAKAIKVIGDSLGEGVERAARRLAKKAAQD